MEVDNDLTEKEMADLQRQYLKEKEERSAREETEQLISEEITRQSKEEAEREQDLRKSEERQHERRRGLQHYDDEDIDNELLVSLQASKEEDDRRKREEERKRDHERERQREMPWDNNRRNLHEAIQNRFAQLQEETERRQRMREDTLSFTEEDRVNIDNDAELERVLQESREEAEREKERVLREQLEKEHLEREERETLLQEQLEYERALLRSKEDEERLARQLIREDQDRAYQESLENDRAKEEAKLREEKEIQEKQHREQEQLEQEELNDAIELSKTLTEEARRERDLRKLVKMLPPEPEASDPNAIRLVIQLPSGERLERYFNLGDTIGDIKTFVDTRSLEENGKMVVPLEYNLVTYPRKVWGDMSMKLMDTHFRKRELIRVELV